MNRPSLVLTEREPSRCRLADEDVDFLLAHHRPHLELQPTRERGTYQLRPRGFVGVINTPGSRLILRPKVPLQNLFYLIDSAFPVQEVDLTELTPGEAPIEFLALRLAQLMSERAKAGLQRGYVEKKERGPFLQGKLDVAAQMRGTPAQKDQLACQFEEFTADIVINQVPRATAEWLLATPFLNEPVRRHLRNALAGYQAVSPISLRGLDLSCLSADHSAAKSDRPLLYLCRLLVECLNASEQAGTAEFPAFLLNLEQAFENFCTRQVLESFSWQEEVRNYRVLAQENMVPHVPGKGLPKLHFQPDVLIWKGLHEGLLVLDVKWKKSPFVRADFNQIISYCAATGFSQGMLVYPGPRNKIWPYHFPATGITIYLQQLNVQGTISACKKSVERWLGKLHNLCKAAEKK